MSEPTLVQTLDAVVRALNQIRNTKLRDQRFKDTYELVQWVEYHANSRRGQPGY